MKRTLSLAICLCLVATAAFAADSGTVARDYSGLRIAIDGPGVRLTSSGQLNSSKAIGDTFILYGGPGPITEGRFQSSPDGGLPQAQGWFGVDNSEKDPAWRASSRSPNADSDLVTPDGFTGPAVNTAALCNNDATVPGSDPTYTGYGDGWNMWLVFQVDVTANGIDPAADTTDVRWTCEWKTDLEACCDFLLLQVNKQGAGYSTVFTGIGTTFTPPFVGDFPAVDFDSDINAVGGPISYAPGEYVDDQFVQLRFRVTSDSGWSDQDGLYVSGGRGAAAIDNIQVFLDGTLVSDADFEGPGSPYDLGPAQFADANVGALPGPGTVGWEALPSDFVGDFAKLFASFEAPDPCRENDTPQWTFLDNGDQPSNWAGNPADWPNVAAALPGFPSEPVNGDYAYGPNGHVTNYTGGLTAGASPLDNSVWSPPIWTDPAGTVTGVTNGGYLFGYTSWRHLVRANRIYSYFGVRSRAPGGDWGGIQGGPFVYYNPDTSWGNYAHFVTDDIVANAESIQIALTVLDLAYIWGIEGDDATPSPTFDNVYLKKFDVAGPDFTTRGIDISNDSFPADGTKTGTCRFDASIDINQDIHIPADSITCDIIAVIPGTNLIPPPTGGVGGRMVVNHLVNPDYNMAARPGMALVGGTLIGQDPQTGWDIYEYFVGGTQSTTIAGDPIVDRYFWDLPDGDAFGANVPHWVDEPALQYPGDVLHWYLQAFDDQGGVSTLPNDTSGFGDFTEGNVFNRQYVKRSLPTLVNGVQPNVLFWNDNGHRAREAEYITAFRQNGLVEGQDYDTYTTNGPSSGVANGLGSTYHGAVSGQIEDYDCLVYVLGDLTAYAISDGSNTGSNDFSRDVQLLTAWANQPLERYHAYFGDNIAQSLTDHGGTTSTYLSEVLGVDFKGGNVGPQIEDQVAARVIPTGANGAYVSEYVAYGGCLVINDFDWIDPLTGAQTAHEFLATNGLPYPPIPDPPSASVQWIRLEGEEGSEVLKHTIVFPYDLREVRPSFPEDGSSLPPAGVTARSILLGEIFAAWGKPTGPAIGVNKPPALSFALDQNYPNPFNPKTTIKFNMPYRGEVSVKVYNVRGELVTTLFNGVKDAGEQSVIWNGKDSNGAQVSTGVYLYKASFAGTELVKKMALIK